MKTISLLLMLLIFAFSGCSDDSSNTTGIIDDEDDTENVEDDNSSGDEQEDENDENVDEDEDDNENVDNEDEEQAGFIYFDNFENNPELSGDGATNTDNQTDLGASFNYYNDEDDNFFDGGYWYAYNDKDNGGNSSAVPDYIVDSEFEGGLSDEGKDGGQCLHIKIQLGDPTDVNNTAFYGVGANIRTEKDYFDLSGMESISFDVKGEGEMVVKFLTKITSQYTWGDMVKNFPLTDEWTNIVVNASDLEPEKYSPTEEDGITWDDVKGEVNKIHFQTYGEKMKAGDTVDFYIDNIKIHGYNSPSELKPVE